jgi:predicted TIM-barrel fold metal-dependent hydrolase
MSFIDSDTHVVECEHTWDFLDPDERDCRPKVVNGFWRVEDLHYWISAVIDRTHRETFPTASVDLADPSARIRRMDELGVDVHVMFPTFWLMADILSPAVEAALARSYNRWLAEATADSKGRLLWALQAPVRSIDRALEELEFGRKHGAVAVHFRGIRHDLGIGDRSYWPIYARAQDLDLAIAVHVGANMRTFYSQPHTFLYANLAPAPMAMCAVLTTGLHQRFPRLRWAFLEAGATWLPWALQECLRADNFTAQRIFSRDWRAAARGLLSEQNLYVGCQADDDLPYLLQYAGENNLVHGTDYGHLDVGSDPAGLRTISQRTDVDPAAARKIVDANGRRLYGIDSAFRPADKAGA